MSDEVIGEINYWGKQSDNEKGFEDWRNWTFRHLFIA